MAKKMWGARFTKPIDPLVEEFSKSIQYDFKLAEFDCWGSIAHVTVLKKAQLLTNSESDKLIKGLKLILDNIKNEKFKVDNTTEDIHTFIQNELQKNVGDLVYKLQTARSRNDQVVFATKLYSKNQLKKIILLTQTLISAFEDLSKQNKDLILPGFTHMQHAQPVYLKDYLSAYKEMFLRDKKRLQFILDNIQLTMGSGALAGTPIEAADYKIDVGDFKVIPTINSLDTVSDRDFVIEIISALSILGMHLSRFCEDMIIWFTKEFDFIDIDESFCTGSSLMPQKKNADFLELSRSYSSRLIGNLVSVLTMMKALPLTYNRDMQLDKEPLFNSIEIVSAELSIFAKLVKTLQFKKEQINKYLDDESLYATDLVYYLVFKGVAFKQAHNIIGQLIKYSQVNNIKIKEIEENKLKEFCNCFVKKEILNLFKADLSVSLKKSIKR